MRGLPSAIESEVRRTPSGYSSHMLQLGACLRCALLAQVAKDLLLVRNHLPLPRLVVAGFALPQQSLHPVDQRNAVQLWRRWGKSTARAKVTQSVTRRPGSSSISGVVASQCVGGS